MNKGEIIVLIIFCIIGLALLILACLIAFRSMITCKCWETEPEATATEPKANLTTREFPFAFEASMEQLKEIEEQFQETAKAFAEKEGASEPDLKISYEEKEETIDSIFTLTLDVEFEGAEAKQFFFTNFPDEVCDCIVIV